MLWLFPEPLQRREVASSWAERKYSEKLENIRVVWRIFVQWYIFFWTINIGILQFQLPYLTGASKPGAMEIFIAGLFTFLNILGIGVCYVVSASLRSTNRQARELSAKIDGSTDHPFDPMVINYSTVACAASLIVNCALWSVITAFESVGGEAVWRWVQRLIGG